MLTNPSPRRQVPVRLYDLPEAVRMTGARMACAIEPEPDMKLGILAAAIMPSKTTYYVAPGSGLVASESGKTCAFCVEPFVSRRGDTLYCSPRCRKTAGKARAKRRAA